jgi:hypothetical protein
MGEKIDYNKKIKEIVSGMMKENTGRHFLDSGGIGGRGWERNQTRDFEKEPTCFVHLEGDAETKEVKELWVTYNLYWFLINFLYLDEETDFVNQCFQEFAQSEEMKEESWEDCLDEFHKKTKSRYRGGDYTYNSGGECILSQDIVYDIVSFDSVDFIIIRIHNGCDARGGFTAPYFFKCDENAYFRCAMSDVTAYCPGKTEAMSVEKGDMFNFPETRCGNVWDTHNGCYSWDYEGDRQDHKHKYADFFSAVEYDGENDCLRCKDCGEKIEFYVTESY